jgi:hypothetical protein
MLSLMASSVRDVSSPDLGGVKPWWTAFSFAKLFFTHLSEIRKEVQLNVLSLRMDLGS